jgi:NAD(P) transhydrogenase subunit alpha
MRHRDLVGGVFLALAAGLPWAGTVLVAAQDAAPASGAGHETSADFWGLLFVFVLASFIGLGVIRRVSRLLHTPLMSITNAISAIAVVGSIIVAGGDYPPHIRMMGGVALFASMTNIVSGFLITNRMLKMFKTDEKRGEGGKA